MSDIMIEYDYDSMKSVVSSEIPAFLLKVWNLVEDEQYNNQIAWHPNGKSFFILNQNQFSQHILPMFFKHSHFTSFVRQLNMYGFRKVMNIANSIISDGNERIEFWHPEFIRGCQDRLVNVKRKSPASLRIGSKTIKTADLENLVSGFEQIRGRQTSIVDEMRDLRKENFQLREEVSLLKNKIQRHDNILQAIMNVFLRNAIYQDRSNALNYKRKRLMAPSDSSAMLALSRQAPMLPIDNSSDYSYGVGGPAEQIYDNINNTENPNFHVVNLLAPTTTINNNNNNNNNNNSSNSSNININNNNNQGRSLELYRQPDETNNYYNHVTDSNSTNLHISESVRQGILAKTMNNITPQYQQQQDFSFQPQPQPTHTSFVEAPQDASALTFQASNVTDIANPDMASSNYPFDYLGDLTNVDPSLLAEIWINNNDNSNNYDPSYNLYPNNNNNNINNFNNINNNKSNEVNQLLTTELENQLQQFNIGVANQALMQQFDTSYLMDKNNV